MREKCHWRQNSQSVWKNVGAPKSWNYKQNTTRSEDPSKPMIWICPRNGGSTVKLTATQTARTKDLSGNIIYYWHFKSQEYEVFPFGKNWQETRKKVENTQKIGSHISWENVRTNISTFKYFYPPHLSEKNTWNISFLGNVESHLGETNKEQRRKNLSLRVLSLVKGHIKQERKRKRKLDVVIKSIFQEIKERNRGDFSLWNAGSIIGDETQGWQQQCYQGCYCISPSTE